MRSRSPTPTTAVSARSVRRFTLNADPGDSQSSPDVIIFQIPASTNSGFDPLTGIWTITPATPLDTIVRPVIIDGTTQFGYYDFASIDPSVPQEPLVQIAGLNTGDALVLGTFTNPQTGQTTSSAGSSIFGLSVYGFTTGAGIHIETDDNTIAADWIGLGSGIGLPGNSIGVQVDGASNNTLGLATVTVSPPQNSDFSPPPLPIQVNALTVISGNSHQGILIENLVTTPPDPSSTPSQHNQVQHTFIGSDVTGQLAIPNGIGIEISNSMSNTVGGTLAGLVASNLNLISGNNGDGIEVIGSSATNTIINAIVDRTSRARTASHLCITAEMAS